MRAVAPERTKIALDLRNHGQSAHTFEGMSYEQMANDVSSFLEENNIHKACIVGHSMGGKVAMQLALQEPHKVSELIVVDIAPVTYKKSKSPSDPSNAMTAMRAINLSACKRREHVDNALQVQGVASKTVRQFVMTNLRTNTAGTQLYSWRLNLDAIIEALPDLRSFPDTHGRVYSGPTCIIRGGKSPYVPFSVMRLVTTLFPNSKLVTLSEAGHWLQAESPNAFCNAVNDFLASNGTTVD